MCTTCAKERSRQSEKETERAEYMLLKKSEAVERNTEECTKRKHDWPLNSVKSISKVLGFACFNVVGLAGSYVDFAITF